MSRIQLAARILQPLRPTSILDVGCRDCQLADQFPDADYWGADILPDDKGRVRYIGDVMDMELGRTFDAVVALDILEHLDRPSDMFDRLVEASERIILVSLPNTYDLKSRWAFAMKGGLGGKYRFVEETPLDRHRWLMSRQQIIAFYNAKAIKHGFDLKIFELAYGSSGGLTVSALIGRLLSRVLPFSLSSETIFGLFQKTTDPTLQC